MFNSLFSKNQAGSAGYQQVLPPPYSAFNLQARLSVKVILVIGLFFGISHEMKAQLIATFQATPPSQPCTFDGSLCCVSISGAPGSNYTPVLPYTCTIISPVGTFPYTHPCFNGLVAGNYTIQIQDAAGATGTVNATVPNSPNGLPPTTTVDVTPAGCSGGTGSACANVTGGSGSGFTYNWEMFDPPQTNFGTSSCASNMPVGHYTLTVHDIGIPLCYYYYDVYISVEVSEVNATTQAATCDAPCNGTILVDLTEATQPATISWSGTSSGSVSGISTDEYLLTGLCAGTYQITVDDASSCTPIVLSGLNIVLDNADIIISGCNNLVWNPGYFLGQTDVTLSGNLIIQTSACLQIENMTIRLQPGKHITIKSKGKLDAINTTFDAGCGNNWAGIRVEALGNTNCDQQIDRGDLVLENCIITHADIGIANYSNTGTNHGGRITARNSDFINNQRDVNLYNYAATINATVDRYSGLFEYCDFITTAIPHGTDAVKRTRIRIESTNDARFLECNMTNTAPEWYADGYPTAIYSNFSQLQWIGNHNSVISGYFRGIRGVDNFQAPTQCNSQFIVSSDITETEFHCANAIFMNNTIKCDILANTIFPQPSIYSNLSAIHTGIQVQNTNTPTGIKTWIIDNHIDFTGITSTKRGIYLENTRGETNYIVRNDLKNCTEGIIIMGNNRQANSMDGLGGTHFECNVFHTCARDVIVSCSGSTCGTTSSGIANRQANTFGNSTGIYLQSAGNNFTDSENQGNNNPNTPDDIKAGVALPSSMNGFHYTFHQNDFDTDNFDGVIHFPKESSIYLSGIEPYANQNSPYNIVTPHEQFGPLDNFFCDNISYSIPNFPIVLQNISETKEAYEDLSSVFQALIDGGNTDNLKQNVLAGNLSNALSLYYEMISISPSLSDEVMIAAIEKEYDLPASLLTLILSANPTAAKNAAIWEAIEMRNIPLDAFQKAQIKQGFGISSPKEMIADDLGLTYAQLDMFISQAYRYQVQHSSASGITDFINLYNPDIYEHDLSISLMEIQSGYIDDGIDKINSMSERHYIDKVLSEQLVDLTSLILIQTNVVSRDFILTQAEKEILKDVRANDPCGLGNYANNLLIAYSDEESVEYACAENRSIKYSACDQGQKGIQLFPNPTSTDYCILKLDSPALSDVSIQLFSSEGKFICSHTIKAGQFEMPIDLSNLENGLYFVSSNSNGQTYNLKLIKE